MELLKPEPELAGVVSLKSSSRGAAEGHSQKTLGLWQRTLPVPGQ